MSLNSNFSVNKMMKRKLKTLKNELNTEELLAQCDADLEEILEWVHLNYIVKRYLLQPSPLSLTTTHPSSSIKFILRIVFPETNCFL